MIQEAIIKTDAIGKIFCVFKSKQKFIIIRAIQLYRLLLVGVTENPLNLNSTLTNSFPTAHDSEIQEYLVKYLTIIVDYLLTLNPKSQGLVFSTIREMMDFFCKQQMKPMMKMLVTINISN